MGSEQDGECDVNCKGAKVAGLIDFDQRERNVLVSIYCVS